MTAEERLIEAGYEDVMILTNFERVIEDYTKD